MNHPSLFKLKSVGAQLLLAGLMAIFGDIPLAFAEDPIVYSRCARTTGSIDISGTVTVNGVTETQTRTGMRGLDVYDVLPDVSNFFGNFSAPCDLMYRGSDGSERILYNCSTAMGVPAVDQESCAALDPAVSFDGETVAFSVFRGTLYDKTRAINAQVINPNADQAIAGYTAFPNLYLLSTGSHILKVDIATGTTTETPFVSGIFDSGPAYLTDNRIAFTSTRDGHTHTSVWRMGNSGRGNRIWTMDLSPLGDNLDLASHHSLSQEQHPFLLQDGRLAYSSWQIFGGLPFRHTNGSPGFFTTLANLFHIYTQAPDGAGNFAFYGQHSGDHIPSSFGEDHDAAHFLGQTGDGRVWFADYYRANNNGLGVLVGVMPEPHGQEGIRPGPTVARSDSYVPRDVIDYAPWASNDDSMAGAMPLLGDGSAPPPHPSYPDHSLPYVGKVGHPAGLSNNQLMLSWGKGACSIVSSSGIFGSLGLSAPPFTSGTGQGTAINVMASVVDGLGINDTPGCDIGIYRATTIPSAHPSDMEIIVDSPNWHEIMGKAALPYASIHGMARPLQIDRADTLSEHGLLETGTPFGLLGAASITDRETNPRDGIKFQGEHQFNSQGTDTINYGDDELCGVRILGVMPNRSSNSWRDTANVAGERLAILGEFSVLNKDASGARIVDSSGHLDTSFLVRFPANMPYIMQGTDCEGRTLNTDQTWQQLRPGEKKTCGGCHVHSKPSRISFSQSYAATSAYQIPRLGEGNVPLLAGNINGTVNTRNAVPTGEADGFQSYGLQIIYDRDIQPIFNAHCISCHSGASADAGLELDKPTLSPAFNTGFTGNSATTWGCLVRDLGQACVPADKQIQTGAGSGLTFRRPQLTKYLRAFNARGSLLYWKAANQRTDNKTDAEDSIDIDFGSNFTNHDTQITDEELGLISRWIDIGAPGGQHELLDTQKPTLHVAANTGLTSLLIGTADLGSGIDVDSLEVCINDVCTSHTAVLHGITEIPYSATTPGSKVLVRIADKATNTSGNPAGNITEVHRTQAWLATTGSSGNASNLTITPITDKMMDEDSSIVVTVEITDSDPVANTLSVISSSGTISGITNTGFTLTPNADFNGDIFATVTVTDNINASDTATSSFTISVTPLNDAPVAAIVAQTGNLQVGIDDLVLDASPSSDIDGDSLTYSWMQLSGPVVSIIDANSVIASVDKNSLLVGTLEFEVTVSDGTLTDSLSTSVTIGSDTSAPSVPTGLLAIANKSNAASLSWTASNDDTGVSAYRVYRDNVLVGTPSSTSFSELGLTPSTQYTYQVTAIDTTGNESARSVSSVITTGATPAISTLVISPVAVTISIEASLQFVAVGRDQYGDVVPVAPTWNVNGGGSISRTGLFTASDVGDFIVTAIAGPVTAVAAMTIKPFSAKGAMSSIVIFLLDSESDETVP